MSNIYKSAAELIGKTPLLELSNIEKKNDLKANILAKLEYFNPAGSVKDRIAFQMIEDAEKDGTLKPGATIIEPTSGNTGIGLASIATAKGYKAIIVMPETMSVERRNIIKAYGAEIVLTDGTKGMKGAIAKADELSKEIPGSFVAGQFVNPSNPKAHRLTTGPEIWEDTDGNVDYVVALVGTGGTLAGLSRYFKEKNPGIKIIGAQPAVQSRKNVNHPEANTIDGVLAFNDVPAQSVPVFFNPEQVPYDECLDIVAEDAYETGRRLVKSDGVFLGQSAAAALKAATIIAERPEASGKNIAIIMADNAFKYLSTKMYAEE